MKLSRFHIAEVAQSLIGVPCKHLGRDPKVGLDCWGLAMEFYRRLGLVLYDPAVPYDGKWWQNGELFSKFSSVDFIRSDDPVPGSLASMKVHSSVPNHLAIVIDPSFVLNTDFIAGVHRLKLWMVQGKIDCYYKHRNLEVE